MTFAPTPGQQEGPSEHPSMPAMRSGLHNSTSWASVSWEETRVHTKMMKFLTRGFRTVHGTSRISILKIKTDKQILFFLLLPTYLIHFFFFFRKTEHKQGEGSGREKGRERIPCRAWFHSLRSGPEQKSKARSLEAQPAELLRQMLLKYQDLCSLLGSYKVQSGNKRGASGKSF